ncbi:MAG: cytidine deaminase [Lachnospiraceae bacterium]|nr:cytidine deaminase [Lachnospiraceae bacterium]
MDENNTQLQTYEKKVPAVKASGKKLPDAMSDAVCRKLIRVACEYRGKAYAPYSGFKVGAALLTTKHEIIGGCNIENAAYTPTNCAERTAFFKAVSEGQKDFLAIAIVGGKEDIPEEFCAPCGVCRQVMTEFCDSKTFLVILARSEEDYLIYTLEELMPFGFSGKNLGH